MPRETNAARATTQPIAALTIVAVLLLDEVLWVDVGETPVDVDAVVDDGTDAVDDGELELRHVALFESVTVSRSELPYHLAYPGNLSSQIRESSLH